MNSQKKIIAQGAGLSSSLASASLSGISVSMRDFDRILEFNPDENYIVVEAGMQIGQLLQFLTERGYWFAVQPSHSQMSLGSCLAFNVLGKSPYHSGSFGDYVLDFSLFHPRKGEMKIERQHDLFALTLGGLGLTGIVLQMKLKIEKNEAKSVIRKRFAIKSIDEVSELFEKWRDKCHAIYSWHNFNLKAEEFGRGYVYIENYSEEEVTKKFKPSHLNSEIGFLTKMMAPLLCDFINPIYERRQKMRGDVLSLDLLSAAFPFERKVIYYKVCGAKKYYQYQCLVPHDYWYIFIEKFANLKWKWGVECSDAHIRLSSGQGRMLHFAGNGICLCVDILNSPEVLSFLKECDELLVLCKGIPNIATDSRLTPELVQKTYTEFFDFKDQIEIYDQAKSMNSKLRERLDV
jgi:decaprenylphospho-beta-D-ribofuranose 2-oxidase